MILYVFFFFNVKYKLFMILDCTIEKTMIGQW